MAPTGQISDRKAEVPARELVTKAFLLTESGAAYQYELERLLSERDLEILPVLEIGNTETIITCYKREWDIHSSRIYREKRTEKRTAFGSEDRPPDCGDVQPAALSQK